MSHAEFLEKLEMLKQKGIITGQDFEMEKQFLIADEKEARRAKIISLNIVISLFLVLGSILFCLT